MALPSIESMTELVKEAISHLKIDRSDIHHDIRDYDNLEESEFRSIAEELIEGMRQ